MFKIFDRWIRELIGSFAPRADIAWALMALIISDPHLVCDECLEPPHFPH